MEGERGDDNRQLLDRDTNQKLSHDEIAQMKEEGVRGEVRLGDTLQVVIFLHVHVPFFRLSYVKSGINCKVHGAKNMLMLLVFDNPVPIKRAYHLKCECFESPYVLTICHIWCLIDNIIVFIQ